MALSSLALTLNEVASRLELSNNNREASSVRRLAKKFSYTPIRRLSKGEFKTLKRQFPEVRNILSEAKTDSDQAFAQQVAAEVQSLGMSLEVQ